jgi:hypothetical protein
MKILLIIAVFPAFDVQISGGRKYAKQRCSIFGSCLTENCLAKFTSAPIHKHVKTVPNSEA